MNDNRNPSLTENAQRLRREMTDEEKHLWYDFLKQLPININRQKIIGNYIVDFYCAEAKVVIELDGAQHHSKEGFEKDEKRDKDLQSLGLTVLRYTNRQVNLKFRDVCDDIFHHLFKKN